jgi:hypothetical protein
VVRLREVKVRGVLGLVLLALAVLALLPLKPPVPAMDVAPSPPLEVDAVPDRVPELLPLILAEHAKGVVERGCGVMTLFTMELKWKVRELRLLARAYPNSAARHATRIATDRGADFLNRDGAIWLLGLLAQAGRKDVEAELVGLAHDPDPLVANSALSRLAEADDLGVHRALYREQAPGSWVAVRALSFWPDPATEAILRPLAAAEPGGELRLTAEDALRKLALLSSEEGRAALLEMKDSMSTRWAVRAARIHALPGAVAALRRRLDAAPLASYLIQSTIPSRDDKFYDDVLVTYHRMGGRLSEREDQRLRYFGYVGDPVERLAELYALTK